MTMTYKTVTGQITQPGTNVGIRAKVTATPLTTNAMLTFAGDNRISIGPQSALTDSNGNLGTLKIPTNVDIGELYWHIFAESIDKVDGVPKRWTLKAAVEIDGTGTVSLRDLTEIDTTAVDAQIIANLSELVQAAEEAAIQAEAAAAGFDIGTVTTGAAGSSAAATITGTAPDKRLNLTIPTGATGATGPTGATGSTGPTGATGPANSLSIGTVTTGVAGSSADASVTGTAPSQTLSLTIPRGDKGDKGDKGDQGDIGPTGPSGSGTGDVLGPASSVDLRIAVFSGTTGKLLASSSNTVAGVMSRANHTGTQSADTITDGTTNKAFLATERTKLTGVATGATANDTDVNLKARANHTGTQAASTITGLATVATTGAYTDLSGKPTLGTAAAVNTGTTSGTVPLLGASGTLAVARLATGTPDGTKFVRDDGTLAVPSSGGSDLLASTAYNPAAVTNVTNATTTFTDVDATNLILPTFTIPASGAVIFVLSARVGTTVAANPALWGVGVGGTVVAASTARVSAGVANLPARVVHRVKITGLTPGATSSAYRWMHANASAGTTTATTYGGTGTAGEGQALMEVWSA